MPKNLVIPKKGLTFASVLKTASRGGAVVARWAHNPKAGGSIPSPATSRRAILLSFFHTLQFDDFCLAIFLCVNKFTHINIVDFFITHSITSNKFALSSLNQEIRLLAILTSLKLLPLALCVNKFTHTRLLAIFNGSSIENYYSTRQFIAKGNSPPRAEGQRWEAQRVAEQCLETGGMMFERSEFLPPQALRQAASGEVCTD